jgi:exopolysaccharide biosynthesis protein
MKKIKFSFKWLWVSLVSLFLFAGIYFISTMGRPAPIPVKRQLYAGVTYYRKIHYLPHSMIVHILVIDMKKAKGLQFLVTPPNENHTALARTTSQFMEEFDVQIAINGDGFFPWWSRSPLNYYPHVGDPVTPNGFTASYGEIYANGLQDTNPEPTLYISRRGGLEFNHAPNKIFHALSGDRMLIQSGGVIDGLDNSILHPRTAIGINKNGRWLYIVVIDGR